MILAALLALQTAPFATPSFASSGNSTPPVKAQDHAGSGILWQKGDVDGAFALAKASNKPLFLYWGAAWCPPCNQVKSTIFNRQGFIERSRFFVPVYIDGDSPGAQKLGARFKVRGYPTMILFRPDGGEITRLPGEVDGARYLQVLALGMNATHSVKDILRTAQNDAAKLGADDWRLLSFHSWETDEQLVAKKDLAATLQRLAQACPAGDNAVRLDLIALVAAANAKPGEAPVIDKPQALDRLMKTLADGRVARDNMDILTNFSSELSQFLTEASTPAHSREKLLAAWHAALDRLAADTTLSKTDRIGATAAQLALARLATPSGALDPALLKTVRERIAETERATTDSFERQSVISAAAHALSDGGLLDESDALLKAELKRSHSPYYFMLSLAANAEQRHDGAAAIDWFEQAYKGAQGPATRLQWGGTLLRGLVRLSPDDEAKIETAAHSVLKELASTPDAFYERNSREVLRIGEHLLQWNKTGKHETAMARIHGQVKDLCAKVPAADGQRATCEAMLAPGRQAHL